MATKDYLINENVRGMSEVRVIRDDGEQLGVMSPADALKAAEDANKDLVLIAPQSVPPVCKIMDFSKFKFDQQKREKEARKNQHIVETKEVQLSLNIDTHDFETKLNHAIRFLGSGDKVKVAIRFRGRELAHPERGYELMEKFAQSCAEYSNIEKPAKLEGKQMLMFLASKTKK